MAERDGTGRVRRPAVTLFVTAYLLIQGAIPLLLAPGPAQNQFGWQMYSTVESRSYEVVLPDGSLEEVDPSDYLLRNRGDIQVEEQLANAICSRNRSAVGLVVTDALDGASRRYSCAT